MANSLESKMRVVVPYRLFGHACQRLRCFRMHADDERRGEAVSNPSARHADEFIDPLSGTKINADTGEVLE